VAVAGSLFGAGVLGHSLGPLGHGVLGQLTGQQEPDGSLYLPGGDGEPLVVVGEPAGLGSNPLEQVVDERVHDAHGLGRHAGVRVHLLQHLVDVDGVGLLGLLPPLAIGTDSALLGWGIYSRDSFLRGGDGGGLLWWHCDVCCRLVGRLLMASVLPAALSIHFEHISRLT
jgi:hypothetical protein